MFSTRGINILSCEGELRREREREQELFTLGDCFACLAAAESHCV